MARVTERTERSERSRSGPGDESPPSRRLSQAKYHDFQDHLEGIKREYDSIKAQCASLLEENHRLQQAVAMSGSSSPKRGAQGTPMSFNGSLQTFDGKNSMEVSPTNNGRGSLFSTSYEPWEPMRDEQAVARVRPCFREQKRQGAEMRRSAHAATIFGGLSERPVHENEEPPIRCKCQAWDPSSPMRLSFELMTVIVCLHDAIVVPFSLAWDPVQTVAMRVTSFCTLSFWFADMVLNFFTGFYKEGLLIVDLKRIAFRYLTTFFFIDLCINGVDLVTIFMEEVLKNKASSPSLRILRIVKLNRLLRVAVLFNRYKDKFKSSSLDSSSFTMLGLGLRLVAILFFLNHLICCAWYWIGANADLQDTAASWLDMHITSGELKYREASMQMQYLTSLHWAFTQMTPGSMSVVPQNSWERSFNCIVLIIGLFTSALLISQLSAKMVRVQALNHDRLHEMELLTRFLHEQGVPRYLAMRIRRQVRERAEVSKPLTMRDVPPLALLPSTLRHELSCAIFSRTLLSHSVFFVWATGEESLVEDMSSRAIDLEAYSRHDDVFVPLQEATKVYNLRVGTLSYNRVIFTLQEQSAQRANSVYGTNQNGCDGPDSVRKWNDAGEATLSSKAWLSMMALWCKWTYVGTCQATTNAELVALNVESVLEVLERYPSLYKMNRAYALAFSFMANDPEYANEADLDSNPARVLMGMDLDSRCNFCTCIVDSFSPHNADIIDRYVMHKRAKLNPAHRERLTEELDAGKCVITLGGDGQLLRTVLLSVVFITRENGDVLAKIATMKNGHLVPDPVLPGAKLLEKEGFRVAAERVLEEDLPPELAANGSFEWVSSIEENKTKTSATTDIRTTYLKKKFFINYCSRDTMTSPRDLRSVDEHPAMLEDILRSTSRLSNTSGDVNNGPNLKNVFGFRHAVDKTQSAAEHDHFVAAVRLIAQTAMKGRVYEGSRPSLYAWMPPHVFAHLEHHMEELKAMIKDIGPGHFSEEPSYTEGCEPIDLMFESAPDVVMNPGRIERAAL